MSRAGSLGRRAATGQDSDGGRCASGPFSRSLSRLAPRQVGLTLQWACTPALLACEPEGDLRNHRAIVLPRFYDRSMATQTAPSPVAAEPHDWRAAQWPILRLLFPLRPLARTSKDRRWASRRRAQAGVSPDVRCAQAPSPRQHHGPAAPGLSLSGKRDDAAVATGACACRRSHISRACAERPRSRSSW